MSPNTRGALWMAGSIGWFTTMSVLVRLLSEGYSTFELVFFRSLVGLVLLAPLVFRRGGTGFRTTKMKLHLFRAGAAYAGVITYFYALGAMPLADVTALHFTLPLFGMLGAMLVLGETVYRHRWIAAMIGFAGTLVVIRPGFASIDAVAFLVLFSAASYAATDLAGKVLARTEDPNQIVFYLNFILVPVSLAGALFFWVTPPLADYPWLFALGAATALAHMCLIRAFVAADASAMMPLSFLRLPLIAATGFVLFGEVPNLWTMIGAVIIFSGAYFATWRERALARRGAAPAHSAARS